MKTKILILGLLALGIVGSIKDYKSFRYEEMKNFGHGPTLEERLAMSGVRTKLYQNDIARVRISVPESWEMLENPKFDGKKSLEEILRKGQRLEVASLNDQIKLSLELTEESLVDIANAEAKILPVSREREYINTDKVNIVVLTWKDGDIEKQRALVRTFGNKLVVLDQDRVGGWEQILKSVVIF